VHLGLCSVHPFDTATKRLATNNTRVVAGSFEASLHNAQRVVFRDAAALPLHQGVMSLYGGLGFGVAYKLMQRVYKYS
jgi:hypothetical protein